MTLDELRAKLDKLKSARYLGVHEIEYVGNGVSRRASWKSDIEMATAIAALETEIAEAEGTPKSRNLIVRCSKGW